MSRKPKTVLTDVTYCLHEAEMLAHAVTKMLVDVDLGIKPPLRELRIRLERFNRAFDRVITS